MPDTLPALSPDHPGPLEAEFDMTLAEVTAFFRYHTEDSPLARCAYWLGCVFFVVILPGAIWITDVNIWSEAKPCGFCLLVAAPIVCLTYRWWRIPVLRLGLAYTLHTIRKKGQLCRKLVRFTPEEIVDALPPEARTVYPWRDVRRVVRHVGHVFLYLGHAKAIVIPQRAFATPADFDAFVTTAENFRNNAHMRAR